jgi:hypothetical protein
MITSVANSIMTNQDRRTNVNEIIESIKKDYYRRPGEEEDDESRTFPGGEILDIVIERAEVYVPLLKERIESEIRDVATNNTEEYMFRREYYYRAASGLYRGKDIHTFRVDLTRDAIIDRDVRERDKRRAENVMFRYYFLKKIRATRETGPLENLAMIPSEVAAHITGFIRNMWPDGYAEFGLANSFEEYIRRGKGFKARFPDTVFSEDMAIYPEEQKTNLAQLMRYVESIVSGVVNTPADERKAFYKDKAPTVDAVDTRITKTAEDYTFLMERHADIFHAFFENYLLRITRANPKRIDLETRNTAIHPIVPTEMRIERMHIVLETFGRRDAFVFLERMMQENVNAILVRRQELQRQRNAIRDAIVLGLKTTPPVKKKTRIGTHARHLLDYSGIHEKRMKERARCGGTEREAQRGKEGTLVPPHALYF